MVRETKTAVKMLASRPKVSVTAKPLTGPVPKMNRMPAETMVVTCVSTNGDERAGHAEAVLHGGRGRSCPERSSSRTRSKISTLESTPIPMVRITPAMPGKRKHRMAEAHEAKQDDQVQEQREVRVDAARHGSRPA